MSDKSDQQKAERETGRQGMGDSGGGAYPNPHSGKKGGKSDGFFGHGGQSEMEYHGSGRLGEEKVGENASAPVEKDGPGSD